MSNSTYKVMIVDDSSSVRGYLKRVLQKDPQIEICAEAQNGQVAVDLVGDFKPDVILLDIEMPIMSGIDALPLLLKQSPDSRIIMVSSLTTANAALSIEALSKGASDYVEKPSADTNKEEFKRELIEKIKAIVDSAKIVPDSEFNFLKSEGTIQMPESLLNIKAPQATSQPSTAPQNSSKKDTPQQPSVVKRKIEIASSNFLPKALAIGSSTGGPQALQEFFGVIGTSINHIPIFITQHMPPQFTTFLAKSIASISGITCIEPIDGQRVESGFAYVAPGDYHMIIKSAGTHNIIKLNKGEQENFCRPAVDPMLRSLVEVYGKNILTVIMTGMGQDGLKGSMAVHEKGGKVIIQDEASSIVWGMPGAIANAGFQDGVFPLSELPRQVIKLCKGGL